VDLRDLCGSRFARYAKSLTIISALVYPITLWKSCDCPPGIPSARSAWIDH
jgi:hypothetical protein